MTQKRLFIAVPIQEEAIQKVTELQLAWKKDLGLNEEALVPVEKLHLTIHFLGKAEEGSLPRWIAALNQYSKTPKFALSLNRFLAFPNNDSARVITLAGSSGNSPLSHLFFRMKTTVEEMGVKVEDRIFVPHITLFRVANLKIKEVPVLEKSIDVLVNKFAIYESQTQQGKNNYTILNEWNFK